MLIGWGIIANKILKDMKGDEIIVQIPFSLIEKFMKLMKRKKE